MAEPTRSLTTVDGLAQTSFVIQGMLGRHAAAHGLSTIQARLLAVLRDRRPTMNELARLLDLDKSSASGLVDRAQRRGLVTREPSPADGRSVLVGLTPAGRALVTEVATRFADEVDGLLAPLGATDRARLAALLTRVLVGQASSRGLDLFDVTPRPQ